ncbi:MAG: hypothetical protein FWE40_02685 [Oscillospiraceae bacterium]|nr:hypothetical protein [Oscillospiraceae bacterium]
MLLQSNSNVIEPLPALPHDWPSGSFEGLVARGNFVVGCTWQNMRLTKMTIHARRGGVCTVRYLGICSAQVTDENGKAIHATAMDGEIVLDMNANRVCLLKMP